MRVQHECNLGSAGHSPQATAGPAGSVVDGFFACVLVALDARRLFGGEGEEVVLRGAEAAYVDCEGWPALLAAGAEQEAGVFAPRPVLRHADRVGALVEEVELLDRLAEVFDVFSERFDLFLEV